MSSPIGAATPPANPHQPIHITLVHTAHGLRAFTNMAAPQRGAPLTLAESTALGMVNTARGGGVEVVYGYNPTVEFLKDLTHPEALGYQATPEIRQRARDVRERGE